MRPTDFNFLSDLPATVHPCDETGRLIGEAPHLYILRAPGTLICRSHVAVPDDLVFELAELLARPRGQPNAWDRELGDLVAALGRWSPVRSIFAGSVYRFGEDPPDSESVVLGPNDARLLQAEMPEWVEPLGRGTPMVGVLLGGRVISVCASVRTSSTLHCAGVETAPRHRGQGYAARSVAGWARLVRDRGVEPSFETTFENLASQAVAARLGLRPIASALSVRCAV